MTRFATTPFGARTLSAVSMQMQERVARKQQKQREERETGGSNTALGVDKYQLLRALTEAREAYHLSDRTIAVLEALLSFHPSKQLDGAEPIIVFPSNAELSLRTRGMAPATLRRHLACLVDVGFIIRRDSPNGKRYCKRDHTGQIEAAFGFDLSPFALEANEIHQMAEQARAWALALSRVRGEITIHLRDIFKTIEAARADAMQGDWQDFSDRLKALSGRVSRTASLEDHKKRCDALVRLRAEVEIAYLDGLQEHELNEKDEEINTIMSANEQFFEHHIQNSKTESNLDISNEKEKEATSGIYTETSERDEIRQDDEASVEAAKRSIPPLGHVLRVCPEIAHYAKEGPESLRDWRDLRKTADLVCQILGISPDAWESARRIMGDVVASITVAAMLERAQNIKSAGGYLRTLTNRAEQGRFTVWPMIRALENRQ